MFHKFLRYVSPPPKREGDHISFAFHVKSVIIALYEVNHLNPSFHHLQIGLVTSIIYLVGWFIPCSSQCVVVRMQPWWEPWYPPKKKKMSLRHLPPAAPQETGLLERERRLMRSKSVLVNLDSSVSSVFSSLSAHAVSPAPNDCSMTTVKQSEDLLSWPSRVIRACLQSHSSSLPVLHLCDNKHGEMTDPHSLSEEKKL